MKSPTFQPYLLHVALPFGVGSLVYLVGRPLCVFSINKVVSLDMHTIPSKFPLWLRFSFPDGLWLYSFLMWLILLWQKRINVESFVWYCIVILIAFGSEILQYFSLMKGTFDMNDICSYCLGLVLCTYNYYHLNKKTT